MTEQSAPDITTGFIQMVEAFKAKPELEAKINDLETQRDMLESESRSMLDTVSRLRAELDNAAQDKARLTRERDEAMFRSLELEEKTNAVSDLVAKLEGLVRSESVAKVEAPAPVSKGTSEVSTSLANREWKNTEYGDAEGATSQGQDYSHLHEDHPEYEPNAEQRSNVEDQYRDYHEAHKDSIQSEQGKSEAPNWNAPTKSEQNASEQSMGDTNVTKDEDYYREREAHTLPGFVYDRDADKYRQHENNGKPHSEKPWWVNDNDWRKQGGQGPYEGGSWTAPWERQSA